MVITPSPKTTSQTSSRRIYLLLILLLILLLVLGFFLWWRIYSVKVERITSTRQTTPQLPKVEIDYNLLTNPFLKELRLSEEINPFEVELVRENPFLPY
jgi:uncharacterized membrane protein